MSRAFAFALCAFGTAWARFAAGSVGAASAEAVEAARVAETARSAGWLNLLYYDRTGSGWKSRVEKPAFFVDPERGRVDPEAELRANLAAFRSKTPVSPEKAEADDFPQCRFPARYRFLRARFALPEPIRCRRMDAWKGSYRPTGLKLVYASQYIANPASVFGHAFLVAASESPSKAFWLTYNFAADMPKGTNAFEYAVGGVFGGFGGDYSVLPYYQRLFQYGAVENRDLWVFDVKMSADELDFFFAHMWELVHFARFTYYFLDENCAGALMRTFAAVLPDTAAARAQGAYVHPADVVRTLRRAGRIAKVDLEPSEGGRLRESVVRLNARQRSRFFSALSDPDAPLDDADSEVAEALIHYVSFQSHRNQGETPIDLKALERNALVRRSRFPPGQDAAVSPERLAKSPHLAHESMAVQVGGGVSSSPGFQARASVDFGFRFAIHDLLDRNEGYLENSAIEVLNVQASARADSIWIREATLARMENYRPIDLYDPVGSWRAKIAVVDNVWTETLGDVAGSLSGGYGASVRAGRALAFGLLTVDAHFGSVLPQGRAQLGPEIGVVWQGSLARVHAAAGLGADAIDGLRNRYQRASLGVGFSLSSDWAVVQRLEWNRLSDRELESVRAELAFRRYF